MCKKFNILVVDDEIKNIQLGINILKKNPFYNLIFATNANETFQRIKDYSFDLILLDIIMQPLDGFEVCKELKSNNATKDIPIIFLTAKTDEESILKAFKLGGVDYITKPFNENELEARVYTHIQLKALKDNLQEENDKKDKILLQQSKMNAIGEMIDYLAHQWRQPLSIVSANASAIQIQMQLDSIESEAIVNYSNEIIKTTNTLSSVVDDFKEFFQPDTSTQFFNLSFVIQKTLRMLEGTFKFHDIKVIFEAKDISFYGYKCAIMYTMINLLSNALFALTKVDSTSRYIFIELEATETNIKISVKDSANGIPQTISNRIFEQYFSTKNLYEGSGLGLYMTKEVVEKKLLGAIEFQNETYDYQNKNLTGAKFILTLPIDKK
ncbi:MAG: hybrid sensor histidine kinase/response regulator [Arcobacteraceae bacterium]